MKILFIYPSDNRTFNAGLAYLSAVLKKDGHQTGLFMTDRFDTSELDQQLHEFKPDLVAVSSVTNQFPLAQQLIGYAKEKTGVPLVLGGVHATLMPEEAILTEGLDALCIGEGEDSLCEYVRRLETGQSLTAVEGFWVKEKGVIQRNQVRQPVQDLTSLPPPDYALFDYATILEQMGVFMVFANRGCPFECSYCINHSLMKLYKPGHYVRAMPVSHLLTLLKEVLAPYPQTRVIEFFDDTFILNKKWLTEFAERYPVEIGLPFYCNGRANLVDQSVVDLLVQAGCQRVNMAIETGNEHLRLTVLKKNVTNQELITAFGLLKSAGISTYAHNMVGIPYETEESMQETIALNRRLEVDNLQCYVFYPYPGSSAHDLCLREGWMTGRKSATVAGSIVVSPLDQPTITYERVSLYHRIFKYLVLGPRTPEAEIPLDYMLLGQVEGQMISGWNNLENDKEVLFRWTAEDGRCYLRNSAKKYLSLLANFPASIQPALIEVSINGLKIGHIIPARGVWRWYNFALPTFSEPLLEISLTSDKPYLPRQHDPRDLRVLGLAVSKIVLKTGWQLFREKYFPVSRI